ncbi:LolA family protein [Treponema sp.]|uniref:LolA family protein n=1 Tax=Treponema sp. TaxID=166 RepID=UPI0038906F21
MKNLKIISAAFFLLFSSLCFAQNSSGNSDFEKVCTKISSQKITKGNFNQTKLIKKISREIKSSGTFIICADRGILWNTLKPFKSSMAITKSGIIQTAPNGKKTFLNSGSNATFVQFSLLISSLFNGDFDSLNKNFDIEFIDSEESWNMNLTPTDSTVRTFIEVIEMAGDSKINSMVLHEPAGDFTKYEFSNQTYPDSLSDDEKSAFEE